MAYELGICIVAYKKPLFQSETVISLLGAIESLATINAVVVLIDNSEASVICEADIVRAAEEFRLRDVTFVCDKTFDNRPLSKIYNKFVSDFVCDHYAFFDDDTSVTLKYLDEVLNGMYRRVDAMVPRVVCHGRVYSPRREPALVNYFNRKRVFNFPEGYFGLTSSVNFFAITSGMVISREVADSVPFDEAFSLYGIDSYFWLCYQRMYRNVVVMDANIDHRLSYFDSNSLNSFCFRFEARLMAQILLARKIGRFRVTTLVSGFFKGLYVSLKYRSFRPSAVFFKVVYKMYVER